MNDAAAQRPTPPWPPVPPRSRPLARAAVAADVILKPAASGAFVARVMQDSAGRLGVDWRWLCPDDARRAARQIERDAAADDDDAGDCDDEPFEGLEALLDAVFDPALLPTPDPTADPSSLPPFPMSNPLLDAPAPADDATAADEFLSPLAAAFDSDVDDDDVDEEEVAADEELDEDDDLEEDDEFDDEDDEDEEDDELDEEDDEEEEEEEDEFEDDEDDDELDDED